MKKAGMKNHMFGEIKDKKTAIVNKKIGVCVNRFLCILEIR